MEKCGAQTKDGKSCSQPAGFRTSHPGTDKCYFHDDDRILHNSEKLKGGVCKCRSRWEKFAMEQLDLDPSVRRYEYEPRGLILYDYQGTNHRYTPDLYIHYRNGLRKIVEIKNILEIGNFVKDEENNAKFKAADDFATMVEEREFKIWVYDNYEKEEWSYEQFCENIGRVG